MKLKKYKLNQTKKLTMLEFIPVYSKA